MFVFCTHPQIHTVCSLGTWGPIYLHAVEEEEAIGVGDKTKKEVEEKRKQQGIMEETQRSRHISLHFPRTDQTNLLCFSSRGSSVFPKNHACFTVWAKANC